MIVRAGTGWQTMLADLCLILFIVTASALNPENGRKQDDHKVTAVEASPQAEPLSVYRTGRDAPPLGQWLAAQGSDPRQLLTIVSTYRPGRQAEAMATAENLARQADAAGRTARIVVEPGSGDASATLAFDQPDKTLAYGLHEGR